MTEKLVTFHVDLEEAYKEILRELIEAKCIKHKIVDIGPAKGMHYLEIDVEKP